jgi:E3 ubiquitin-protein ligase RNF115/126
MRYSDITNNHRTYDACPITREPFATDERVLMLQCNHYFSENGLNRWLALHSTCPVCRFNINNTNPANVNYE